MLACSGLVVVAWTAVRTYVLPDVFYLLFRVYVIFDFWGGGVITHCLFAAWGWGDLTRTARFVNQCA